MDSPYGPAPQAPLHEVEWRIDGKPIERDGTWRVRYVPYLDARWAASALDDWVGPQNWRRDFHHVTFRGLECVTCDVEIWFPPVFEGEANYEIAPGRWVGKPDIGLIEGGGQTGTKGTYSDAFKRSACVAWGVGRNVYELPGDIWAECKVWMRPGRNGGPAEPVARPHPGAVGQIRAELEKRGHEILHLTAEPKVGGLSSDTDGTPEDADTIDAEQVATIAQQFAGLAGETLAAAKAEFFRTWGKAADIAAKNYEQALEAAHRIAADHEPAAPVAEPTSEPQSQPTEDPPSGEAAGADASGGSPPAPAGVGLTNEDIDAMTAKGLAEHLAQFDLPLTGNMASKKARLKEAIAPFARTDETAPGVSMELWQAGAVYDAHPVTGEKLYPVTQYVEGITKYEDALTEEAQELWNEWLAETFPDSVWPPTMQYEAFIAYQTIDHLNTHGALPHA